MFQRLEDVEKRYEELNKLISDPEVISRQSEWTKLMKEHSDIEDIVLKYREYKTVSKNLEDAKEMMEDPEMKEEMLKKLNIQTENRLCNPGYEEHAIKLKKDSPVTLEYLAYLLMSPETQEYISNIDDKNGSFMPRDLLYKEIAINSDKAVQHQIVEEALIRERQATGLGVEYNIVILSSKDIATSL